MTTTPDIDHLRQWIGRTQEATDIITAQLVKGLRATLFLDIGNPVEGDIAPYTTHWCLAQPVVPMNELGPDGHPARGGFLPPVPLPRRMWAGGQIEFVDPLRVGDTVTRASKITDVTLKTGSTGALCFVAVDHTITTPRGVAIKERHDIVYRNIAPAGEAKTPAPPAPAPAAKQRESHLGRSGIAVPLFGADLQRPPHPLRPRLCHQGGRLSGPDRARPVCRRHC